MCVGVSGPQISRQLICADAHWQAVKKLKELQERPGMRPDAVSYSCAITACQRSGEADLALQLFDEMLLVPLPGYFASRHVLVLVLVHGLLQCSKF